MTADNNTLDVLGKKKEEYGGNYADHLLDMYKMYVEMADRISARRHSANSFFLSINTAIVALVGYVRLGSESSKPESFYSLIAVAGIILCYLWYRLIRSYKDLNSGKFKVIHEIEAKLPLRLFDAEWQAVGRGKRPDLYLPFTIVELRVPWVFAFIHAFVLLKSIIFAIIKLC